VTGHRLVKAFRLGEMEAGAGGMHNDLAGVAILRPAMHAECPSRSATLSCNPRSNNLDDPSWPLAPDPVTPLEPECSVDTTVPEQSNQPYDNRRRNHAASTTATGSKHYAKTGILCVLNGVGGIVAKPNRWCWTFRHRNLFPVKGARFVRALQSDCFTFP